MLRIAQCSDLFYPITDGVSRVVNAYGAETRRTRPIP